MRRRRLKALATLAAGAALVAGVATGCGDDDEAAGDTAASGSPQGPIEGTVTSPEGPEAGVWVIAETDDLATPYRKIVVTDDDGRFVVPDLPEADYDVWVRGYGLRDSEKVSAEVGNSVEVSTEVATPQEAARNYPSNYWLSMYEAPEGSATGEWLTDFKLTCMLCHQFGSIPTRQGTTSEWYDQGLHKASVMWASVDRLGGDALLASLADWGQRIRDGEIPEEAPPRPTGVERNMVVTQWEWGDGFTYAHDEVSTDKRDPTVNGGGPVWGVDLGNDRLLKLDPATHETTMIDVPTRDGFDTPWCDQTYRGPDGGEPQPAGFGTLGCPAEGGETAFEGAYDNPANPHNPMLDADGKVWMTTQIRREWADDLPEFCKDDPVIRDNTHHRQLGYYDPETESFELVDTCTGSHHLQFDDSGVLWVSGDSNALGWIDPSKYDPERPDETLPEAHGYAAHMIDSNGDGTADTPLQGFNYGIVPSPDGTIWTASPGVPGHLLRYDPAEEAFEVFSPPVPARGPRGVDVDTDGVIWTATGSGHLASFDRRECAQTWGEGAQCPEGWTIHDVPGPRMQSEPGPDNEQLADFHYYLWVDQHDTLGMGENTVIINGTDSDSLIAFDQAEQEFHHIRVPYPLNTFTRGLDGRIDDADAGWKGRGLWFTNGLDPILHAETGRGYIGQVQMRPDPLAQ